jgi:hypothetical protein
MTGSVEYGERPGLVPFIQETGWRGHGLPELVDVRGVSRGGGKAAAMNRVGIGAKIGGIVPVYGDFRRRTVRKRGIAGKGGNQFRQGRDMVEMAVGKKDVPGIEF